MVMKNYSNSLTKAGLLIAVVLLFGVFMMSCGPSEMVGELEKKAADLEAKVAELQKANADLEKSAAAAGNTLETVKAWGNLLSV